MIKPYLKIVIPLIFAHILQSAGGLVDGLWVGQLQGVQGVAAISAFFPVFFLILSAIVGMSASTSVLVGKAWGAKNIPHMRSVVGTAILVAGFCGLVVSIIGGLFANSLMTALGTPQNVLEEATAYAQTLLLAMPLTFTLWTCMAVSRGAGDQLTPIWAMVIATVFGVIITPLLITGWGIFPALGVRGVAVSNILVQAAACATLLWRFFRSRNPLVAGAKLSDFLYRREAAWMMLKIGFPASLQMMSMGLAEIVLLGIINKHGSDMTAAYGAVTQLLTWIQFPAMCIGIAAAILSAHVIGADRPHRIQAVLKAGMVLNVVITTAFVATGSILAPAALRWLLEDEKVSAIAVGFLRTVAWSVVFLGWSNVFVGTMRACGVVWIPAALGLLAILCVELPAALILERYFGIGGLWWAYPVGFAAMLLFHWLYYATRWNFRVGKFPLASG